MIEIKNLSKSFGDNHVLKNISVKFQRGKVNMIIGQSGSGKSVLAKCVVGLLKPDSGEVEYDNQDFIAMDLDEKIEVRKNIGMLFQGGALFDSMTVEENIMFPLTMFTDMKKSEMRDRANECLERVNLAGKNDLYPAETSGGMQKRIAIARAISMKPKYLFCDEPNSGLDPQTSIVIDNLIRDITEEMDITTVVISHDMNSVIEIGDYIMFIYKGENWWEGTSKEILSTKNQEINDFVYASEFMKTLKDKLA
ncbi:ABC transporter ATP-binding protein [Cryomorpha ignava]|uniref:ABC transporter ATP-binding protein n=1 Tax=Cryomorpha ignava TaxID=101383 RepID=A0A7K3WP79_9FLAO|nr:ABC transporter ATP-binding protein [Cryomorpha ignava]NEN23376.1 ABC transporter ATP-binding protein [Cryomorpha ignava]